MILYQTPCGTWCGSQAAWAKTMKAEGLDSKQDIAKFTRDIPVSKAALMEFLTFHNVNTINPSSPPPAIAPQEAAPRPPTDDDRATTGTDLDEAFATAPIGQQLRLAVAAIDAASARIR